MRVFSIKSSKRITTAIAALAGLLVVSGCAGVTVSRYKDENPRLVLEDFFAGELEAFGIVRDRSGVVLKRFVCAMKGTREGDELVLHEDFTWSDGTLQTRVWRLRKTGTGRYVGTAGDVVGEAQAEVAGNAMHLTYTLEVPLNGSTTRLAVDDWLYLVSDAVMINHSRLSKFGFSAAEVLLAIRKQ
jgi:hypothetical protein